MARGGTDEGLVQVDAVMRASRVLVAVVAQSISAVEDQVTFVQFRMLVVIASRGPLNLGEVARQHGGSSLECDPDGRQARNRGTG